MSLHHTVRRALQPGFADRITALERRISAKSAGCSVLVNQSDSGRPRAAGFLVDCAQSL
jgi:hypothetical protein